MWYPTGEVISYAMDSPPLYKVTAFVVRDSRQSRELLVFRHPTGGVQLPAGTVEDREDPRDAVLREVNEETGLVGTEIVRELAVEETILPSDKCIVLRTTPILLEPRAGAPAHEVIARNGFWLDAGETCGDYRAVTHSIHDFRNGEFVPTQSWSGWALDACLTRRQIRHHYLIRPTAPTPDRWTHFAEDEYDFELYWIPVDSDPGLAGVQDGWRRFLTFDLSD